MQRILFCGLLAAISLICWSATQPATAASDTERKERVYAKPNDDEIRQQLTPMQYKVTQDEGTEPPFRNALWDNKKAGIYVDIVSGEPLFSSKEKFDSGTGWAFILGAPGKRPHRRAHGPEVLHGTNRGPIQTRRLSPRALCSVTAPNPPANATASTPPVSDSSPPKILAGEGFEEYSKLFEGQ